MQRMDEERLDRVRQRLRIGPTTVRDIMALAGISRRSAYRWVDTLAAQGEQIIRIRHPQQGWAYQILR